MTMMTYGEQITKCWVTVDDILGQLPKASAKLGMAFTKYPATPAEVEPLGEQFIAMIIAINREWERLCQSGGAELQRNLKRAMKRMIKGAELFVASLAHGHNRKVSINESMVGSGQLFDAVNKVAGVPRTNHLAVAMVVSGTAGILQDCLVEFQDTIEEQEEDTGGGAMNQDASVWSEDELKRMTYITGLLKVAVKFTGKVLELLIAQEMTLEADIKLLNTTEDEIAANIRDLSEAADNLANDVYPPFVVKNAMAAADEFVAQADRAFAPLRSYLAIVAPGQDLPGWVAFLDTALKHNAAKFRQGLSSS